MGGLNLVMLYVGGAWARHLLPLSCLPWAYVSKGKLDLGMPAAKPKPARARPPAPTPPPQH